MSERRGERAAARRTSEPVDVGRPGARYVLITQCLQNDLFLDPECRLFIGDEAVRKLLIAKRDYEAYRGEGDPRRIAPELLDRGPLKLFLEACIGKRLAGQQPGTLHVINIRDWHAADDSYDAERRLYGRHCEAGTWGARYIDGLARYLDPLDPLPDGSAAFCRQGTASVYHIHSDSVFDFRPRWDERHAGGPKFRRSHLERLMDILVTGSDEQVADLAEKLEEHAELPPEEQARSARRQSQVLEQLAEHAVTSNEAAGTVQLYVGVIGIYTDIKITILLSSLRARYEIRNLAVSDTLTASKSLERHLHGLDFADKLLGVETIHGLGDLCRFLGTEPPLEDESEVVAAEPYAQYRTYFADKQAVLAYESEKLQQYQRLTERRSIRVYDTVRRANGFLLFFGTMFLFVALAAALVTLVWPSHGSWELTAATGGLGLAGLVTVFFKGPMRDLQQNLNNLAAFRMVLEGHSLKTAFARYHLTTPEVLGELKNDGDAARADAQIKSLESQLAVIDRHQSSDYEALERAVGFGLADRDGAGANGAGAPSAATPQAGPDAEG